MLQLGHWVRSLPSQADAGLSLCSAPQGPGCPASALPPPQIHAIAGETEAQPWCSQGWAWVWARSSGLPKENGRVHLLSATNCLESWLPTVPGLLPRIGEHWEWHKGIGWGGGGEASPSICSAPGHQRHQCQCIPLGVGCSQGAVSSQDPAH